MKFNTDLLKQKLADMNVNPSVDCEKYSSKDEYLEWVKDYVEYEIVQPLERQSAQNAGVDIYDCDECENNEEARDIVIDFISNVERELL